MRAQFADYPDKERDEPRSSETSPVPDPHRPLRNRDQGRAQSGRDQRSSDPDESLPKAIGTEDDEGYNSELDDPEGGCRPEKEFPAPDFSDPGRKWQAGLRRRTPRSN